MKKSEFVQFSCALHPDHVAWLRSKKDDGYNMSALLRQAIDEFIEKYAPIMDIDDADFCDACGGGQEYHDLVELPVEGSPEAEALQKWLKEKDQRSTIDNQDNDDSDEEKLPF